MVKKAAPVTGTKPRFLFKKAVEGKKEAKWYPAEDVPKPRKRAFKPTAAKLRKSITPGTVLILLAGRFKGKRVVFLKQLPSGLLLVTGPYNVNGVPLRRVNQAYVIATSTKIDVSKVKVADALNDEFFKATKEKEGKAPGAPKETSDERKKLQEGVDAAVKLTDVQKQYLKSKFAISKGMKVHELKF
jgi:large subunit ribosomal protein L6e